MSARLNQARLRIDEIDREMVRLMAERMQAVRQVGSVKHADPGAPLRDDARERAVVSNWLKEAGAHDLSRYYVGRVLREVMNYSRRMQEEILDRSADPAARNLRVGFQGVEGSFSSLALAKIFAAKGRDAVRGIGFRSFTQAVDALEAGELDYTVLPIENTIAGSLNETYALLAERSVQIVGEEILPVEHCLAAVPGAALDGIRTIRSHAVALQQCGRWLSRMPGCRTEARSDTAGAAESVARSEDPSLAAICSEEAASRLGLTVLARGLSDQPDNRTRFVLVGLEAEAPDPRLPAKTSLILALNHRRGALARCLDEWARRDINLTKLESRPRPEGPWEYLFYLDIEGHVEDPRVKEALEEIAPFVNTLKVLGCYPRRARDDEEIPPAAEAGHEDAKPVTIRTAPSPARAPGHLRHAGLSEGRDPSVVHIGGAPVGGGHFMLIAGPCAVENRAQVMAAAAMVRESGAQVMRGGAFKPRTSPYSFQGLGYEGLDLLRAAGDAYELPVITEVLRPEDVARVARTADALQIGARNMQNFELLKQVGRTDRPVLLKRGLSASIDDLLAAAEYVMAGGNRQVILCERGIRTFETATRSTLDVSAVPVLRERTHLPVIVDPSHAAGRRGLVLPLALAAVAAGADGLIVECHPDPAHALCDKEQALTHEDMAELKAKLGMERLRRAI